MAPEVWKGQVTPKADVFSIGIVLFELLSFELPFSPPSTREEAVVYWRSKPDVAWQQAKQLPLSSRMHAVALCRQMLTMDVQRRPSAVACLKFEFVAVRTGHVESAAPERLEKLLQVLNGTLEQRSTLYRSVALMVARVWPANQLPTIKLLFEELDVESTGHLTKLQIAHGLGRMGVEANLAYQAADAIGASCHGMVGWTQFVAACIHLGSSSLEDDLKHVFEIADKDRDGFLSQTDLQRLLATDSLPAETNLCDEQDGHTQLGNQIDWPTFLHHFTCRLA